MAQTIGQHGVAAFTNPSNGDALDATVVKGNDNSIRSAYVDHDSDPGIHVQSSLLSARPVAGVAGRKWITTDTGSLRLWFDNGSAWEAVSATTPNALTLGSYLTGTSYDGSAAVTTNVNASTTSAVSTVVARDAAGEIAAKKVKLDGSTSGVVGIQAAAIAGTWTATLPDSAGTTGQVLTTDGSGGLSWTTTAGASISISESTTSAPFYPVFFSATSGSTSALNTDGSLSWNPGTNTLDVVGPASVRSVEFDGTTSGTVTVQPAAAAGTWSLTLPTTAGSANQVLTTNGSGVTSWASPAQPINEQTFNASGTWTKPSAGSMALIEVWGSGGGGSNSTTGTAAGGAGGNYLFRVLPLSSLGATGSILVGAGGIGAAIATNANGGSGNPSQFNSGSVTLTASGSNPSANGFTTSPSQNVGSGSTIAFLMSNTATSISTQQISQMAFVDGIFSGGYGGAGTVGVFTQSSVYGGGGGAAQTVVGAGSSVFGGNGGAVATNGTAPGGGGGASNNVTKGGDGGAGRVKVTVW